MKFVALILVILVLWVFVVGSIFGAFWTYSLNYWLTYMGKPTVNFLYTGLLLGICPGVGQLGLPFAAGTFIASLFM